MVGFIEDDAFVGGKHMGAFGTECEFGKEEGVVDDEYLGVLEFLSGLHVVTGFIEGAAFAGAVTVFGTDGGPDVRVGLFLEFLEGAVADTTIVGCLGEGFELAGFFGVE